MDFLISVKTCLRQYATFRGRASRSEFWYWNLFTWILCTVAFTIDSASTGNATPLESTYIVSSVVQLLICLPTLAVCWRRLHDVNRSGWWMLLVLTLLGNVLLLYWFVKPGLGAENKFGSMAESPA